MTYSPLITETMPPRRQAYGDKWSPRPDGVVIDGLIVHHWAGTGHSGISRLVDSPDKASANYLIYDGIIVGSVPEEYRAWTSGSYAADATKITVEVQDETGAPEWRISDENMAALAALYADVAHRHGFITDRAHISGHRDYAATSCPGPYLYPRLGDVAAAASGAPLEPTPAPVSRPIAPPVGRVTVGRPVADVQRLVGASPDGIYGPDTTAKVKAWQGAHGLVPDGIWGPLSDAAGFPPAPPSGGPTLSVGSKGAAVRQLQTVLNRDYPAYSKLVVDGDFGPKTKAVVMEFQRRAGLVVDGVVGPKTRGALHL